MSFLLPAQDPSVAKSRRRKLFFVCVALLLGVISVKPLVRCFRDLRLRKSIAEGEAYLAQGRRAEALNAGRDAFKRGIESARLNALLLNTLGSDNPKEAFYFWTQLARARDLTIEQRRSLVRWPVSWGQPELAEPHWQALLKADATSTETLRLGAALCEARGDARGAVRYAGAALQADPRDAQTKLVLGRVLTQSKAERDVNVGKRLLLEQARRNDSVGIAALRFLSGIDVLTPFEATECIRLLEANPARTTRDILIAARLRAGITPYKAEEIVAGAVKEFREKKGDLAVLAAWLRKAADWNALLLAISEEEAMKRKELLLARVDALGALNRWSEIEQLLAKKGAPIDPLSAALYLTRVASQQQQNRIATMRWNDALEIAGKDELALSKVADYARRSGADEVAVAACEKLIAQKGEIGQRGYRELLGLCSADLGKARGVLQRFCADYPEDLAARNDLAYANLFFGGAPEGVLASLKTDGEKQSQFMGWRTTRALALLRNGEAGRAKAAFGIEPARWPELLPYQQAIYAATVAAAGDTALARDICREIDVARLRREEKELIKQWL